MQQAPVKFDMVIFYGACKGDTHGQVLGISPLPPKKLAPTTQAIELVALSFYHLLSHLSGW